MLNNRLLIFAIAIGFLLRIILAFGFEGTGDTGSWMLGAKTGIEKQDFGYGVNPYDGSCLPNCILLNWPPLTFHYMTFMGHVDRNLNFIGLPEWGFYKLLPVIADSAIILLIYFLAKKIKTVNPVYSAVIYSLHPIALYVSGYHGQRDSIWLLFLLLALLVNSRASFLSGLLIGAGASFKVPILFLAPLFFFNYSTLKEKYMFAVTVFITFFILNLPEIYLYPNRVVELVFFYKGWTGWWGLSGLINGGLPIIGFGDFVQLASDIHRILFFGVIVLGSYFLARRKVDMTWAALIVITGIFVFGTSFAAQYLIWPLPFLAIYYRKIKGYFVAYTLYGTYLVANFYSIFGIWLFEQIVLVIPREYMFYRWEWFVYPLDLGYPLWIISILLLLTLLRPVFSGRSSKLTFVRPGNTKNTKAKT